MSAFASLPEIKEWLGIPNAKTIDDALLTTLANGQAARLSRVTGRSFTPDPAFDNDGEDTAPDSVVTLQGNHRRRISIPDARVVTSVAVDGTTLDPATYRLVGDELATTDLDLVPEHHGWPGAAVLPWGPAWGGFGPGHNLGRVVTITGRFGITPVPDDVIDAYRLMVSRAYKEREARYGDLVQLPDGGSVNYFKQLPPSVQQTLALISRSPRLA